MAACPRPTTVALALLLATTPSLAAGVEGPDLAASRTGCRAALQHGDQTTARAACDRAFLMGGNAEDMHNRVESLVVGPARPLMAEMVSASMLADATVRVAPREPWGYLARAEIALRFADRDMLDAAIGDLRRAAPDHEVTKRAIALAEPHISIWMWLWRLGLGLALLGTAAHVLWSWWRARATRGTRLPAGSIALIILLAAAPGVLASPMPPSAGNAEALERPADMPATPIDDAHPEASIPSVKDQIGNPMKFGYLLQDLLAKAQSASARGDHAAAARFYLALAKAVPTRSYAFSKLCEEQLANGDRPRAIAACRTALYKDGVTVHEYKRFVGLVLAAPGPLPEAERQELAALMTHLAAEPTTAVAAEQMRCEVALRLNDVPALEACTAALAQKAPADATTVSFQWALALTRRDHASAARLVERARAAGMASEGLARMERLTSSLAWSRIGRAALWGLGGVFVLILVAAGARRVVAQRRRLPV